MEECYKCHTPETKAILFDVILPDRIDKICGKCSSSEDSPVVKNMEFSGGSKERKQSVRERLVKLSGFDVHGSKSTLGTVDADKALKEMIQNNPPERFPDSDLKDKLVDNFHWIVMRARRMKHITQEQLAKEIREPFDEVKIIEQGEIPKNREVVRKLESFLNIKIWKDEPLDYERENKSRFDVKQADNLTISDLQKMKEGNKRTLVIASGYFNPLHNGHIDYLELSKKLGDKLVVVVNNDRQQIIKRGHILLDEGQRMKIVEALKPVDKVFLSIDRDLSVSESIKQIYFHNKDFYNHFIFSNGGDRHIIEIPETEICRKLGIEMKEGIGKKVESSSEMLERYKLK